MAKRFPISISFNRAVIERLTKLAAAQGISRSQLVEKLTVEGLDDAEVFVKAMNNPVISQAMLGAIAKPDVLRALVGSMREELSDEQLQLFTHAMSAAQGVVHGQAARAAAEKQQKGKSQQGRAGRSRVSERRSGK